VNIGPAIQGTLIELTVKEGDYVRKGQLIARLDNSGPLAAYRQAQATYQAQLSMVPEAQRTLQYQQQSTQATIDKAKAALDAQRAKVAGARRQEGVTSATTLNQVEQARAQAAAASATRDQAEAQVQSAMATRATNQQAVVTAEEGYANAEQGITTAQNALQAAQSKEAGARAEAARASRDAQREYQLYLQDAVSAQAYDQARTTAEDLATQADADHASSLQAASQLEAAKRTASQQRSLVAQARRTVDQSTAQVRAAQKAADAAGEQVRVARAGIGVAEANLGQVGVQQSNVQSTSSQTGENAADVAAARANLTQNALRQEQVSTAQAQARQAEAALKNAKVTLDDCYIYAPTDGMVVRKDANAGQVVSPGTTLVTITKGNHVWVEANFKETQLANVRPGESVEIEVDAYPGKVYHGEVESINEATGASTALLPPDNSTGNFTKVVQRIAVRIHFVPYNGENAGDLNGLRQGMSVTATIDTDTGPPPNGPKRASAIPSGALPDSKETPDA
jgi:membrane fusion protein (multidrug efflux system)